RAHRGGHGAHRREDRGRIRRGGRRRTCLARPRARARAFPRLLAVAHMDSRFRVDAGDDAGAHKLVIDTKIASLFGTMPARTPVLPSSSSTRASLRAPACPHKTKPIPPPG